MKEYVLNKYGCPDIVFNNAAVLHLGDVGTVSSRDWDNGYFVNLKAPVLLVNSFLGAMKQKKFRGVCICLQRRSGCSYGRIRNI